MPVEQTTYVKYLGLIVNCHLNWKKHVHEVSKKISRGIASYLSSGISLLMIFSLSFIIPLCISFLPMAWLSGEIPLPQL